jgi:hypothetical protein
MPPFAGRETTRSRVPAWAGPQRSAQLRAS